MEQKEEMLPLKHFVSIDDFSKEEMEAVFDLADRIIDSNIENVGFALDFALNFWASEERPTGKQRKRASCAGKIMGLAFYEPSTRTRLSFETAMLRLGGSVIGFSDPRLTSAEKGETLPDTIRILSSYCDVLVLRHPLEGAAKLASENSEVPVINAGDGAHQHPTQTLVDIFTLRRKKGPLEGLKVGLLGDLKYGRTVHSLSLALLRFGAKPVFISPPGLRMPEAMLERLRAEGDGDFEQGEKLEEYLPDLDALYVTRIQKERFPPHSKEYEKVRGAYVINAETMAAARSDTLVLHPLPRVDEIDPNFDDDPRAIYFRQASYGVPIRMALVALLVAASAAFAEEAEDASRTQMTSETVVLVRGGTCENKNCVTRAMPYVMTKFARSYGSKGLICFYCETPKGE